MERARLGEFERYVLLAIAHLRGRGYGVSIAEKLEHTTGRSISLGAVYATIDRLEAKKLISSELGEATPERGGRPKRYYRVEAEGRQVLNEARAEYRRVWDPPLPAGVRIAGSSGTPA